MTLCGTCMKLARHKHYTRMTHTWYLHDAPACASYLHGQSLVQDRHCVAACSQGCGLQPGREGCQGGEGRAVCPVNSLLSPLPPSNRVSMSGSCTVSCMGHARYHAWIMHGSCKVSRKDHAGFTFSALTRQTFRSFRLPASSLVSDACQPSSSRRV